MKDHKLAGWAGIVFSLLSLIVLPVAFPPPPALGASGSDIAQWFTAHRTGFLIGNYLGILAFLPGLVQLAVFAARVRRLEDDGFLWMLVLATGTFGYAVFACSLVVFQVLPFLISDLAAGILGTMANVWFALDGLAALPLVVAVAWAGRRTRSLPGWFVPFSALVALLSGVMSLGAFTTSLPLAGGGPATGLGFIAFFLWTGTWAVLMLRWP